MPGRRTILLALLLLAAAASAAPEPAAVPRARREPARGVTLRTGVATARAAFLDPAAVREGPGRWRGVTDIAAGLGADVGRADDEGIVTLSAPVTDRDVLLVVVSPGFAPRLIGPGTFRDGDALDVSLRSGSIQAGRVLDADGKPVERARVLLLEEPAPGWLEGTRPALRGFSARTDARGEFRLVDLPGGPFLAAVEAGDRGTLLLEGRWPTAAPLTLRLPKPGAVGGTIRAEPEGRPVKGARVLLLPLAANPFRQPRKTMTDAAGRWRIGGLPEAGFRLRIEAKGLLLTRRREVVPRAGEDRPDLDATLRELGSLTGRVVTVTTNPIVGAEVFLAYPPADREYPVPDPDRPAGVTDEAGRFTLDALPPEGRLRVTIRAAGLAPRVLEDVALPGGEPTALPPVILHRGASVTGRATAAEAPESPLAGVLVIVVPADEDALTVLASGAGSRHRRTETGEDGAFLVGGLGAGDYRLAAFRGDRLPAVTRTFTLEGPEGDPVALTVSLAAGVSLAGDIRTPDDAPVGGARVRVTPEDGGPRTRRTTSAADGTFRISGLSPGTYIVTVAAEGFAPLRRAGIAPERRLRLVLGRLGALMGRVVPGPDAAAVPPFTLTALRRIERDADVPGTVHFEHVLKRRFRTADGAFRIEGLAPGLYRLEVVLAGGRTGSAEGARVTAGETTTGIVIRTQPSGTLAGRVVRRVTGRPVEGATVSVLSPGSPGPAATTLSDSDGEFRLDGVPSGPVTILVRARDLAPVRREGVRILAGLRLRVDEIELDAGGEVRVVVRSIAGGALAGAGFALESLDDGRTRREVTDAEGVARFDLLRAGAYRLWRDPGEGAVSGWIVRVEDGPPTEIRLDPGARVRLEGIVSRGGQPVPGVRVELIRPGVPGDARTARRVSRATTDADGRYVFPGIDAGEHVVRVRPPGGATRLIAATIPAVPDHRLDLTLPEESLAVDVFDAAGGGTLSGATVVVRRREIGGGRGLLAALAREAARGVTDARGRILVSGLEPGSYRLETFRDGHARAVEDVTIEAGDGLVTVSVRLGAAGALVGEVLDLRQEPVAGAVVIVRDAAGRPVTRRERIPVGADGRFRVDGLETGAYRISAEAPGHAREARGGLFVVAGSETEVRLRLQEEGRLRVTVFGPGGLVLRGAAVAVLDAFGNPVWPAREDADLYRVYGAGWHTDSRGEVSVRGLPAGIHVVRASAEGLRPFSVRVLVQGGVETRAAVVLLPD